MVLHLFSIFHLLNALPFVRLFRQCKRLLVRRVPAPLVAIGCAIGLGLGFSTQLGNCVGRGMGCFQYFFTLNFLNMSKIKFHEALFFCQDGCDVEAFNVGTLEKQKFSTAIGSTTHMPILKPFTPEKLQMLSSYMLRNNGDVILTDCAVGERLTDILEEILVFAANGYDVFNWIGQGLAVTQEQYDKMKSDREKGIRSIPGKTTHFAVVCRTQRDFDLFVKGQVLPQYSERLFVASRRKRVINRPYKGDVSTTVYWLAMSMDHIEGRVFNDVIYLDGWFMLDKAEQIKTYIKSHLVSFDLNDVSL